MKRNLRAPRSDAPPWVHRAWRRIDQDGDAVAAAARAEGKHHSSLRRYVVVGEAERVNEKLKGWRADNPEHAARMAREGAQRRLEADPEGEGERRREAKRAWTRDPAHRGTCQTCDGPMGIDVPEDGTCSGCRAAATEARYRDIERLWKAGKSMKEIAEETGLTPRAVGPTMARMRRSGRFDLPYRR